MPTPSLSSRPEGSPQEVPSRIFAESKSSVTGNHGIKVVRAITVRKPAAELYAFWNNFENLAEVIRHPVTITRTSENESLWSVSAPGGGRVEWTAAVVNAHAGRMIAWRSLEGADVPNAGSVRFEDAPGELGTEITVALEYEPVGGKFGALVAKLTGKEAGQQVADTLRRFKALMETGEIPSIKGQSVGEPQRSKLEKEAQA